MSSRALVLVLMLIMAAMVVANHALPMLLGTIAHLLGLTINLWNQNGGTLLILSSKPPSKASYLDLHCCLLSVLKGQLRLPLER
jgi:hypothetical protein